MPLALLLHERLGVITGGMGRVASFGTIMDKATLVLRRRQGAFLHHWFGLGLPIDGLDLRVAVVNAPHLQARVRAIRGIQDRYRRSESGPNLLEPIAGMAGVLAGMLIGGLLGAIVSGTVLLGLLRLQLRFFSRIGQVIGGGWSLWRGWKRLRGAVGEESSDVGGWYDAGRSGARWAAAGIRLGESALGRRPDRPTTVLDAVLILLDRVAAFVAQIVGAAATFLHLIPVLWVLAGAVAPLCGLVDVGRTIAERAIETTVESVTGAIRHSGILHLPALLGRGFAVASKRIVAFLEGGLAAVRSPFTALAEGLVAGWSSAVVPVLKQVATHPMLTLLKGMAGLGAYIRRLGTDISGLFPAIGRNMLPASVDAVIGAVRAIASKFSSGGSSGPGIGARAWAWVRRRLLGGGGPSLPPITPPPTLITPTIAPAVVAAAQLEVNELPMHIVGSVPRVIPAEAVRLEPRLREAEADPAYRAANLVLAAAGRLAGPEVDAQLTSLTARLDQLEASLRRRPRPEAPVRDVPPPRRLIPVLRRIRVTGSEERSLPEVRSWVDTVITGLVAAPFAVPAAASGRG